MFVTSLKKKIVNGQNLNAKNKNEDGPAVLGLSASFYELNRTSDSSRVLHFPCALWSSLVALQRRMNCSKKNDERKLENQKDHCPALQTGGFEGTNGRTLRKLVVP